MAIQLGLEVGSHGFECPYCHQTLRVESWDTEYGDPLEGQSWVFCPCCDKGFAIDVCVSVHITPSKEYQ